MIDEGDGVYTIAVASRLTGMHPQTLRKYERAGLLTPARQQGNQRLYSHADLERLRQVNVFLIDVGEIQPRNVGISSLRLSRARRCNQTLCGNRS